LRYRNKRNILQNQRLTSLKAGWGTCLDASKESRMGLTTAGRKRPEILTRQ
jgi:hypothetical protein